MAGGGSMGDATGPGYPCPLDVRPHSERMEWGEMALAGASLIAAALGYIYEQRRDRERAQEVEQLREDVAQLKADMVEMRGWRDRLNRAW